ncbi:hypothetical protein BLNAU_1466 [Blattamonas nauphoetae]|uniref:Uncharacterized protein n=1 Tax=Blattamonas nauphoetae TaxID=2049346 RepID=A0ABQ9YIE7_9EUKA|nr:hypothetical protein BLNAU_1466 [Blattamonas nauphoetae]
MTFSKLIDTFQAIFDLSNCRQLTKLSLQNNPVTQLPNYRFHIIAICPTLVELDSLKVTEEEKDLCNEVLTQEAKSLAIMIGNDFLIRKVEKLIIQCHLQYDLVNLFRNPEYSLLSHSGPPPFPANATSTSLINNSSEWFEYYTNDEKEFERMTLENHLYAEIQRAWKLRWPRGLEVRSSSNGRSLRESSTFRSTSQHIPSFKAWEIAQSDVLLAQQNALTQLLVELDQSVEELNEAKGDRRARLDFTVQHSDMGRFEEIENERQKRFAQQIQQTDTSQEEVEEEEFDEDQYDQSNKSEEMVDANEDAPEKEFTTPPKHMSTPRRQTKTKTARETTSEKQPKRKHSPTQSHRPHENAKQGSVPTKEHTKERDQPTSPRSKTSAKNEIERLADIVRSNEELISILQTDKEELRQTIERAKSDAEIAQKERDSMEQRLAEAEQLAHTFEQEVRRLEMDKAKLKEKKSKAKRAQHESRQLLETLQNERDTVTQQFSELQLQHLSREESQRMLERTISQYEQDKESLEAERKRIEQELKELQKQAEGDNEMIGLMQVEKMRHLDSIAHLEEQLADFGEKEKELSQTKRALGGREEELRQIQSELEKKQQKLAEWERLMDETSQAAEKTVQQLDEVEREKKRLEEQMRSTADEQTHRIATLEGELKQEKSDRSRIEAELTALKETEERERQQVEHLEAEKKELELEVEELKELRTELSHAKNSNTQTQTLVTELKETERTLRLTIDTLESKQNTLQQTNKEQQTEIERLTTQLGQAEQEKTQTKQDLTHTQHKLQSSERTSQLLLKLVTHQRSRMIVSGAFWIWRTQTLKHENEIIRTSHFKTMEDLSARPTSQRPLTPSAEQPLFPLTPHSPSLPFVPTFPPQTSTPSVSHDVIQLLQKTTAEVAQLKSENQNLLTSLEDAQQQLSAAQNDLILFENEREDMETERRMAEDEVQAAEERMEKERMGWILTRRELESRVAELEEQLQSEEEEQQRQQIAEKTQQINSIDAVRSLNEVVADLRQTLHEKEEGISIQNEQLKEKDATIAVLETSVSAAEMTRKLLEEEIRKMRSELLVLTEKTNSMEDNEARAVRHLAERDNTLNVLSTQLDVLHTGFNTSIRMTKNEPSSPVQTRRTRDSSNPLSMNQTGTLNQPTPTHRTSRTRFAEPNTALDDTLQRTQARTDSLPSAVQQRPSSPPFTDFSQTFQSAHTPSSFHIRSEPRRETSAPLSERFQRIATRVLSDKGQDNTQTPSSTTGNLQSSRKTHQNSLRYAPVSSFSQNRPFIASVQSPNVTLANIHNSTDILSSRIDSLLKSRSG